jgi:hypothetical protein
MQMLRINAVQRACERLNSDRKSTLKLLLRNDRSVRSDARNTVV